MRRLRLPLLAASVLLACSASVAAADAPAVIPAAAVHTAEQLRDTAMHDDTAYRIVEGLTTEVGPRLAGGPSDRRARDWVVAKMKALGFDRVYTEPVSYPLWERCSESGEIVAPFPQKLVLTALGYSPARRWRFGSVADAHQGCSVADPGRHLLLRLTPHRGRHAGQDRPQRPGAERGGLRGGGTGEGRLRLSPRRLPRRARRVIVRGLASFVWEGLQPRRVSPRRCWTSRG